MRNITGSIADDLHFDMAEAIDCRLFSEDLLGGAFFHRSLNQGRKLLFIANEANTSATASVDCLDHERVPDLRSKAVDIIDTACWVE